MPCGTSQCKRQPPWPVGLAFRFEAGASMDNISETPSIHPSFSNRNALTYWGKNTNIFFPNMLVIPCFLAFCLKVQGAQIEETPGLLCSKARLRVRFQESPKLFRV